MAQTRIQAGDILLVDLVAERADIETMAREPDPERLPLTGRYFADRAQNLGMVEVILPEGSSLIGKTLAGVAFRARYGVTAAGLKRGL